MIGAMDDERTFEVELEELLGHLRKNRGEHAEIVEKAQVGFRKACIERLDQMLIQARAGTAINMHLGLTIPTSHTDIFDNAIGLLEMTQRAGATKIDITSTEYKNFVENNWGWSQQFNLSNSPYTKVQ
jgi:hypothetical protein